MILPSSRKRPASGKPTSSRSRPEMTLTRCTNPPGSGTRNGSRKSGTPSASGTGRTCGRIHYRIVSAEKPVERPDGAGPYLNTASCWGLLVNASRDARYLGLIPEDALVDRRAPPPIEHFTAAAEGELEVRDFSLYGLDEDFPDLPSIAFAGANYGPPVLVEVWAEKTTANDVLAPLARRYGANLITGVGEMSEVSTRLFLDRVRAAGTPGRILYVSDFDPAGRSMPVAVARKIEFALHKSGEDLDVHLDPLVLTEDQCREYRLPRTPLKETEKRAARFEERFGAGATELDALEALHPGELERIVRAGIERYLDPDLPRRHAVALQEYRHSLRRITEAVHAQYEDDVDALRGEYADLVAAFSAWRDRAEVTFDRIADDLRDVELPPFFEPRPTPRPQAPEPLFDVSRSYLDQIESYRRWQGKGEL
jgi:hypothetical protein